MHVCKTLFCSARETNFPTMIGTGLCLCGASYSIVVIRRLGKNIGSQLGFYINYQVPMGCRAQAVVRNMPDSLLVGFS